MSDFTREEKRSFRRKKFIKDHAFEWVVDTVLTLLLILLVLWLSETKTYTVGIISTIIYNLAKVLYQIKWFEKDYLDREEK